MRIFHSAAALLCLATAAGTARADDPSRYTLQRIETPPSFQPRGLNAHGDIVGFKLRDWSHVEESDRVGYRQFAGSKPEIIPDAPEGQEFGTLVAINDAGLAVGYVRVEPRVVAPSYVLPGDRVDVVRADGQRIDLVSLLPEGADSYAVDVNSRGDVVGTLLQWSKESGYDYKPFVWSESAGMQFPLGTQPGGREAIAAAVDEAGQLIAHAAAGEDDLIYVWSAERGERYSRYRVGGVYGANNVGQVVGYDYFRQAYVWTIAGGKVGLPRPADRPNAPCEAFDINDAGTIVGQCKFEGVIWTLDSDGQYQVTRLWDLIDFPPDFPKWRYPGNNRPLPMNIDNDGRILFRYGWWTADLYEPEFSAILTPIP
jgi:hypothetical protein